MLLWGQQDGKKGATDVISALHEFIKTIPRACKFLICWFDGTSSQLKNITTLLYFLHLTDPKSPMYRFERVQVRYAVPGHTYSCCDRTFGQISKRIRSKEIIGDPRELIDIIKNKTCSAAWLPRSKHFDWRNYLEQFYTPGNDFMYENDDPLLMKARCFSFGFSDVVGENRSVVTVQHHRNEIRCRLSFDETSQWHSYIVELNVQGAKHEKTVAYPKPLTLENARIRDLRAQKEWLPRKYTNCSIYNLEEEEAIGEDEGDEI
jgi:hypothetical protein